MELLSFFAAAAAQQTAVATWALFGVGAASAIVAGCHPGVSRRDSDSVLIVSTAFEQANSCHGVAPYLLVRNCGRNAAYQIETRVQASKWSRQPGSSRTGRCHQDFLAPGESLTLPWHIIENRETDRERHPLPQFVDVHVSYQLKRKFSHPGRASQYWPPLTQRLKDTFTADSEGYRPALSIDLTQRERRLISPIEPGPPATFEERYRHAEQFLRSP